MTQPTFEKWEISSVCIDTRVPAIGLFIDVGQSSSIAKSLCLGIFKTASASLATNWHVCVFQGLNICVEHGNAWELAVL